MAKIWADRVKETTATTGTGTLTLAGAATQHQSFSAVGNGNTCDYCLLSGNGTDWETGEGTYTAAGTTLSRDTVYASSNGGAKINLSSTSTVFVTVTGRRAARAGLYRAVMSDIPTSAGTGLTTWVNQSTGSVADRAPGVTIVPAASGIQLRTKAAPATPYRIKALVGLTSLATGTPLVGIGWYDGTNKVENIGLWYDAGWKIGVDKWTTPAVYSGVDLAHQATISNPIWFSLRDDGTTVYFEVSADGDDNNFVTAFSVAKASGHLGAAGYANIAFIAGGAATTRGTLMSYGEGT